MLKKTGGIKMKRGIIFITSLFIMLSVVSFGKKLATLPGHARPYALVMDDTQFYVCDKAEVSIYSRKDFKLKTKFGKEGEGPQEFKLPANKEGVFVFPQSDYLLISSMGKASFYSKQGKFIKEVRTDSLLMPGLYQPIGSKFAGLGSTQGGDVSMAFTINLYDAKFKKIKEIYKQDFMQQGSMTFPMVFPILFVEGNKIIAPGGDEFVLNIFDADGNKVSTITRPYERLKVTGDYKKGIHHYFKTDLGTKQYYEAFLKKMLKFRDDFPAIQFFLVDNGRIYIQTYLKKDDKYEFFIYDLEGKLIKRLFFPVKFQDALKPNPFDIEDNTFYQLIENEDEEEWELHAIEIK
jgi:hypothetical protein